MIIVSDTSPVTNLIQIKQLDLLRLLFKKIIIPVSVFEELTVIKEQAAIISNCDWIEIIAAKDKEKIHLYEKEVDKGEAEAIVLAAELHADLLLMDDLKGIHLAEKNGLKIVGFLGVLVTAKNQQLITSIKPLLDSLIHDAGFRISPVLINSILNLTGE